VYAPWQDYAFFRQARIGDCGELVWDDQLDFCPDSLWQQVAGKLVEEPAPASELSPAYA
jgi:hypothetical protein